MLRIIKKSIAWSLAVVMLFTVSPVFADNEAKSGKSEINDISRSWAKSMIEKLSENEIITGYPDGTFRPDKEVSREEACVMIAKYIFAQGADIPVRREPPRPGDIPHSLASVERAERVLGYRPRVSLEEGLREMAGDG